jgi:hypothetical protein
MRRSRGLAALALLVSCVTIAMCVYPTEHDADVFVTIDSLTVDTVSRTPTSVGPLVLIRGDEGDVHATAWHSLSGGAAAPVPNISFRWSVADTTLARIDATTGHLVAIKSGITQVRAVATNFDAGASPATLAIQVSAPLAIDSIRPDTLRYGEIATVYGVGLLDTVGVVLSIGDAVLFAVPFTDSLRANGASQISFWVPPPAHTAPLSYIAFGAGVFGSTPDTVTVIRRDLYEPNEFSPTLIDLETSKPFPGTFLDPLLFANPALAFEQLPRDVLQGVDWYRLRQLTTRNVTIVLSSDVPGTFETFLTDQLTFQLSDTSYHLGADAWTFGPQSHACHGAAFGPKEAPADSTVVALHDFPAGVLDAIAVYSQPGRYALTVYEGYGTTGKGIIRDAHEEDDYCNAADAKPETLPFQDGTLTIDNPHDVDWFRFSFSGGAFQAHTTAPAAGAADPSDIDLYLLRVPAPGDTVMTVVASSARPGSDEDISPLLGIPAGQYYVVVTDFAGVPTRYSLCFGSGFCVPPPAPPAPSPAEVQASVRRRGRLEATLRRGGLRVPPLRPGAALR